MSALDDGPGCCGEPDCTRREPIHLYRADLHNRVFVVTKAHKKESLGDGKARFRAIHRHEITDQMVNFLRRNEEWVRAVLDHSEAARRLTIK